MKTDTLTNLDHDECVHDERGSYLKVLSSSVTQTNHVYFVVAPLSLSMFCAFLPHVDPTAD